jgi:hypothetical protein
VFARVLLILTVFAVSSDVYKDAVNTAFLLAMIEKVWPLGSTGHASSVMISPSDQSERSASTMPIGGLEM